MINLGDFFPKDEKAIQIEKIIQNLRSVIFYHQSNTTPPKEKYCIIVGCFKDKVGVVYVNTNINQAINYDDYLRSLHLKIFSNENAWLKYDSFIDCSNIIEKDLSEIKTLLEASMENHYVGEVSEQILMSIFSKLKISRKVSKAKLKNYHIY